MINMNKTLELKWNARYILKPKLELYFHLNYKEMEQVWNHDTVSSSKNFNHHSTEIGHHQETLMPSHKKDDLKQ